MPAPALSSIELYHQKHIYEETLLRELLAEVHFLWAQMGGRADGRLTFKDKIIKMVGGSISKLLGGAAVANPFIGVAGIALDASQSLLEAYIDHNKQQKVAELGNFFFQTDINQLEIAFRQFAKAASLRYEYLIAVKLSIKPEEGVIPFARIGARRLIEFLVRLAHEFNEKAQGNVQISLIEKIPLTAEMLLNGLIQGHSGKWRDSWRNTKLIAKEEKSINLTAEGAYGRSAMRDIPKIFTATWPIYYPKEILHQQKGQDKYADWGRVSYEQKNDINSGPKYGYMLVPDDVRKSYGFAEKFSSAIVKSDKLNYYPTVKIATQEDVLAYRDKVADEKADDNTESFVSFIQRTYQKENFRIDQVWVRKADFDDEEFIGGDYSNVDFSGCIFNNVTLKNCVFAHTNFNFVQAHGLKSLNVSWLQADCSYADFTNSEFEGEASDFIDTKWVGALLGRFINSKENLLNQINQNKLLQEKQAEEINRKLIELRCQFKGLEEKSEASHKEVEQKLLKVEENLKENAKNIEDLAENLEQSQQNHVIFQLYCQSQLEILESKLITLSSQQDVYKLIVNDRDALKEKINILESTTNKLGLLLAELNNKLESIPLTAESVYQINIEVSDQFSQLRKEVQTQINALDSRMTKLEAKVENMIGSTSKIYASFSAVATVPNAKSTVINEGMTSKDVTKIIKATPKSVLQSGITAHFSAVSLAAGSESSAHNIFGQQSQNSQASSNGVKKK